MFVNIITFVLLFNLSFLEINKKTFMKLKKDYRN